MIIYLKERKQPSGRISFYLYYSVNGKRTKELLQEVYINPDDSKLRKKNVRLLAEQIRGQRQNDVMYRKYNAYNPARSDISFNEYFKQWVGRSGNDPGTYNAVMYQLTRYHKNELLMLQVTVHFLEGFRSHLQVSLANETANGYFRRFKQVVTAAYKSGLLPFNPSSEVPGIRIERPMVSREIPDEDELKLLAATPCKSDVVKRAMLLSAKTGFGPAELASLKPSDVDVKRMQITVYRKKNLKRGMRPVTVPITKNTLLLLGDLSFPDKRLFPLPYRKKANDIIKQWAHDAGISKHITQYCFRHASATHLLNAGVDLLTIAAILGHTTLRNLQRYAHANARVREAIERIG